MWTRRTTRPEGVQGTTWWPGRSAEGACHRRGPSCTGAHKRPSHSRYAKVGPTGRLTIILSTIWLLYYIFPYIVYFFVFISQRFTFITYLYFNNYSISLVFIVPFTIGFYNICPQMQKLDCVGLHPPTIHHLLENVSIIGYWADTAFLPEHGARIHRT